MKRYPFPWFTVLFLFAMLVSIWIDSLDLLIYFGFIMISDILKDIYYAIKEIK